jgi:hypothetical protein
MFIATCLPVAVTVNAWRMNTITSPSSLLAYASGVNSVTGPLELNGAGLAPAVAVCAAAGG